MGQAGKGLPEQLTLAVAGGLLSSSCCILQLALNALSVGCAGALTLLLNPCLVGRAASWPQARLHP